MKKLYLIIISILLCISVKSQTNFEFTSIDSTKLTKSECFTICETWVANNFKNVSQSNRDGGIIIINTNMNIIYSIVSYTDCKILINYKFTVQIKDYKIKITVSNFENPSYNKTFGLSGHDKTFPGGGAFENEKPQCGWQFMPKSDWNNIKQQSLNTSKNKIENLKQTIKNGNTINNW